MVLEERIRMEMDERRVLPDGQAGFRKGRGTMDNVYILHHLAESEIGKEGGRMYALFVDLKAAFDSVKRDKLWECLKKRGINRCLVERLEEIYEETTSKVRVNGVETKAFYTTEGLRQGCPLSPSLFAAYLGDIDNMFKGAQAGGVVVGRVKVWSLAYADDLVIVAREERGMKEMIKNLEKYLKKKQLEVNVEKTKVMIFGKKVRTKPSTKWMWENKELEQVKEFRYLGYVFSSNNSNKNHIREITKKAKKVIGCVWGIGERKFGHDWKIRMRMFDYLVGSMMMYGAEVWGWKEYEDVERVHERYIRWVLGVDGRTPGYIVREEAKREKLRIEAGRRAVRFEERMKERMECEILQECWREVKKQGGKRTWKERDEYYERNGFSCVEIERRREEGMRMEEELCMRDKDIERQERRARMGESRYNAAYECIITERTPKYLERESGKEKKMIARFRCGNEERENMFWLERNERRCRVCGEERETIEHMLRECEGMKEMKERREEILNEDGRGVKWMKEVWRLRRAETREGK